MKSIEPRIIKISNPAYNLPVDTIYYIESLHNTQLNAYVKENKTEIEEMFSDANLLDYKLVYIEPNNFQNFQLHNLLQLKFPGKTQAEIESLQSSILSSAENQNMGLGIAKLFRKMFAAKADVSYKNINFLCRILPNKNESDVYTFLAMDMETVDHEKVYEHIETFVDRLEYHNDVAFNPKHGADTIMFRCAPLDTLDPCASVQDEAEIEELEQLTTKLIAAEEEEKRLLKHDLQEMAQKIRDEIADMQRENGINILIETLGDDLLATLKRLQPPTLSSLTIDENLNIRLPEYQNKEVKMNALSKSLYCLFLLHPKGIRIKDLSNYRSELLAIYKLISNRENLDMLAKSIDELCNPLSNSINEKLSRIRKAFCDIMVNDLAQEYIPDGPRGEAKSIRLDSKLIFLPQILKNIVK